MYRSAVVDVKDKGHHLVVSKVNLKLKFRKSKYSPRCCGLDTLLDESLRETLQEQLNIKLKSLKLNNEEDGWSNFRKIVCEVADGVLGRKDGNVASNISKNALSLVEKRRSVHGNYLSSSLVLSFIDYEQAF